MRTARCACGELRLQVDGEPKLVLMCHCEDCQRRTGAPFGVSAYFAENEITVTGEARDWQRGSDAGRSLTTHFCPTCGTTLYWSLEVMPGMMGVAVGCFNDPDFPPPHRAIHVRRKHAWVPLPEGLPAMETQPG